MIGIVLALIMRAIFIFLGAAAINQFSWVFYIFGAFLLWTAWKQARHHNDDAEAPEENKLAKFARTHLPSTPAWHGTALPIQENGKPLIRTLLLVSLPLGPSARILAPGTTTPLSGPH